MGLKNKLISKSSKIRVGITMGDPSGVGPAIAYGAISKLAGFAQFTIVGNKFVFDLAKKQGHFSKKNKKFNYEFIDLNNVCRKNFRFGKISADYGLASIEYLDKALQLIENKQIDCLVTCPISKQAINLAGFKYAGHTEYFSHKTKTKDFVMMLMNKDLKISLVTRHVPISAVPGCLKRDEIYKTIAITSESLKKLFSITKPRIVVCGLNPHASDNGLIGSQENKIIKPVVRRLKRKIGCIDGPLSADVAIAKTRAGFYDCAIAMYHDQALIPLKLLSAQSGVNITLGLGFVRTSPLHGTAFDIAAAGLARPDSLIEAIKVAVKCALNLKKA